MKGVKVEYPVYFDINKFFLIERTNPDHMEGVLSIHDLTIEINEDYIARSPIPAPRSRFKQIYYGLNEYDNFFLFLVEKPEFLILFDQWLRFGLISYLDGLAKTAYNLNSNIAEADEMLYNALRKVGYVL